MNYFSETLTGGIHHILYGLLKPQRVLKQYESYCSDNDLYHHLKKFPASPDAYMSVHHDIYLRWTSHVTQDSRDNGLNHWRPSFYVVLPELPESFHMLCDFYSIYIHAECRMMIEVAEMLKETLEMFTLKYELLALRDDLLELLRETSSRLHRKHRHDPAPASLPNFVYLVIQQHILATLSELQIRSGHLLNGQVIDTRELYLGYIKQPPPPQKPWYRTAALTQFELEHALRSQETNNQLLSVEALLLHIKKEAANQQADFTDSVNLLENTWFCLFIKAKTDSWHDIDLHRPEQCTQAIGDLQHRLFDPFGDQQHNDKHDGLIIQAVLQHLDLIQSTIQHSSEIEASAAARLAASIEDYYYHKHTLNRASGIGPDLSTVPVVQESSRTMVLDEYILVDQLKEKLGVTQKSLNAYLSESRTPVYKFSNKTKLIHFSDLADMMDHFKTTT